MIKVQSLRWPLAGLVAVIFLATSLNPSTVLGISVAWSNGEYLFAGGTAPWALALAALIALLFFVLMSAEPSENRVPLPGIFRRFVAFGFDLLIAMAAAGPIAGILPALAEWRRAGVFEWTVERNDTAAGDWLLASAGFALSVFTLAFYFTWPLVRRRPSPGACIFGYQVVPDEGTTLSLGHAILRMVLGFVAVGTWYVAPFVARDQKKGKFWLDKIFSTRAVRL